MQISHHVYLTQRLHCTFVFPRVANTTGFEVMNEKDAVHIVKPQNVKAFSTCRVCMKLCRHLIIIFLLFMSVLTDISTWFYITNFQTKSNYFCITVSLYRHLALFDIFWQLGYYLTLGFSGFFYFYFCLFVCCFLRVKWKYNLLFQHSSL